VNVEKPRARNAPAHLATSMETPSWPDSRNVTNATDATVGPGLAVGSGERADDEKVVEPAASLKA
jgi:hypothetical protein